MKKTIKFMHYRFIGYIMSSLMIVVFSVGTYMNGGFNWGIDFIGGVKLIVQFEKNVNIHHIKVLLANKKLKAEVQQLGKEEQNTYIISSRLIGKGETSEKSAEILKSAINSGFKNANYLSVETVGPAIGDFLKRSAVKLILVCMVLMAIYLAFRFQFNFSISAMMMLIHDVGLSMLFLGLMRVEINIPIIAGVLTIFGYSINDTIIVYDRIKENMEAKPQTKLIDLINESITQTLSRTIFTVFTVILSVFCLYIIGEDVINDFAFLLLVGFSLGVYSTFFVACPLVLAWDKYLTKKPKDESKETKAPGKAKVPQRA